MTREEFLPNFAGIAYHRMEQLVPGLGEFFLLMFQKVPTCIMEPFLTDLNFDDMDIKNWFDFEEVINSLGLGEKSFDHLFYLGESIKEGDDYAILGILPEFPLWEEVKDLHINTNEKVLI